MGTIRASCFDCGDVELTTEDVCVRVCAFDNQGTYQFLCPYCQMMVVKPAEPRTVDLLVANGVSYSVWHLPKELFEPRGYPYPITDDDLIDFHEMLQVDAALEYELKLLRIRTKVRA